MNKVVGQEWIVQDGETTVLKISICRQCTARWYPPRDVCSTCASSDLEQTTTQGTGVAYASTVVRVGAPPFRVPYVLSYVDIDGVRLLTHIDGDQALKPDTPVRLTFGQIGADGDTELWSHVAEPITQENNQ